MYQKTFDYYIDFESNDWFSNLIYAWVQRARFVKLDSQ
jgi:hypothetical protein